MSDSAIFADESSVLRSLPQLDRRRVLADWRAKEAQRRALFTQQQSSGKEQLSPMQEFFLKEQLRVGSQAADDSFNINEAVGMSNDGHSEFSDRFPIATEDKDEAEGMLRQVDQQVLTARESVLRDARKRESVLQNRALRQAQEKATAIINKDLTSVRERVAYDLREFSILANAAGSVRRLMTETMTRALAQQQRQIQAEDATLQALAAQDRRFDDMREQREQKIREEVERIKDSEQVRSAQQDMLRRKAAAWEQYLAEVAAISKQAASKEQELRTAREKERAEVSRVFERHVSSFVTDSLRDVRQRDVHDRILKRALIAHRQRQQVEEKKLRRKTLEAQLVLDQLFARKASAFASQRQQQSEEERRKQEVASRVAQEQAKASVSPSQRPQTVALPQSPVQDDLDRKQRMERLRQQRQSTPVTPSEPMFRADPTDSPIMSKRNSIVLTKVEYSPEQVTKFMGMLRTGSQFLKHGRAGRPHKRFVWVTNDKVCWGVTKKVNEKECLELRDVTLVMRGQATAVFARRSGELGRESFSFSLAADERTLDLECDTEPERDLWAQAFEWLVANKDTWAAGAVASAPASPALGAAAAPTATVAE